MTTCIIFQIDPKPTPRPRVARFGGTYYPEGYKHYKEALEAQAENITDILSREEFKVRMEFYVKKPKSTKKVRPSGDVDNYAKGVLDALTGNLWLDDDQVIELTITKQWGDGSVHVYYDEVK